jgi:murein DD-endopeptidase MepM/ murein hydrolase activator NlpD
VAHERAVVERPGRRVAWTIRLTDQTELSIRTDIVVRAPKAFRLPGRRPRRSRGYRTLVVLAYGAVVAALMALAFAGPAAGRPIVDAGGDAVALVRLPASAAASTTARTVALRVTPATTLRPDPPGISTHLVRQGETLFTIAAKYGVSPQTLAFNNGLSDTAQLRPGRTLVVTPPDAALYTVRDGDTVAGIATTFGADADSVRLFNRVEFEAGDLTPGRMLIVPLPDPRIPGFRLRVSEPPRILAPRLRWPVARGVVTQGFSVVHTGVDIAAPFGEPILAPDGGTVTETGWHVGTGGLHVCVRHDWGLETCAYHASAVLVEVGERVLAGQPIANVGSTGHSTGPHVHWEAHANGAFLDPLTWTDPVTAPPTWNGTAP